MKNISLLHIEDDSCYSKMLQIQLSRVAMKKGEPEVSFDVVSSVVDAYKKIDENKYDCIISDFHIVKGSGLEVLNYIKMRKLDIPFIFLTGQGDEGVAREAFIHGANDYFPKDVTIADYDRIYNSIKNQISLIESRKLQEEHEKMYKTIFENTNAAMLLVEEDTTISLVNPEFEKMSGLSRKDIEGKKSWKEFVTKEDLVWMKKNHYMRRKNGNNIPKFYHFHFLDDKDNERYVYLSVAMIPNSNKSLASMIDLTEQKKALSALAESERRYRTLFENSRDAIWTATKDGKIINANKASLDLLGYTHDEFMALNAKSLYSNPDDRQEFIRDVEKHSSIKDFKVGLKRKDGEEIECLFTSTLWQNEAGEILGYQGIVRDVTKNNAVQ